MIGQFTANLKKAGHDTTQEIFVVRGLKKALLGLPAIKALDVVAVVEQVQGEDVTKQFPELFTGLGRLKDNYKIELKSDATPFALTTPRRVPLPLLPKVKAELQCMEDLGVIAKIDTPTEWCAGMVVVPKQEGNVRICVDLTKLNASVCRERVMLPSMEYILAQIGEAKYFSKLDANSGFWQIELDPESSELTTFITPFGRYRFKRLPFGITSGPEHFQRRMSELLQGLEALLMTYLSLEGHEKNTMHVWQPSSLDSAVQVSHSTYKSAYLGRPTSDSLDNWWMNQEHIQTPRGKRRSKR